MIAETLNVIAKTKSKRGFTLTEIAIVLGIIGLILGSIWSAAATVYANQKVKSAEQGILYAAQAIRAMYASSLYTVDYSPSAWNPMTSPGMFPPDWSSTTPGSVGNPWHVNPTSGNYSNVFGLENYFTVELDEISDAGCAAIAAFFSFEASSSGGGPIAGLVGSSVANSVWNPGGYEISLASIPPGGVPVDSSFFNTPSFCNGGGLNDSISVAFDMTAM